MHFGLALPNFRHLASPEYIRRYCLRAEELGYDSLWAADHIVVPTEVAARFGSRFFEPLTTISYVAGFTSRIRVGVSALVLPYRHPVYQAKILATLDALSNGRVLTAVAAGWSEDEMNALGVDVHRRGALADECLRLFREVWSNAQPQFDGPTVHLDGVVFDPRPVQDPLPLWCAGNSDAAIRRAARFCQGWHPLNRTTEEIHRGSSLLREEATAHGRSDEELDVSVRLPVAFSEAPKEEGLPLCGNADDIAKGLRRYVAAGATYFVLDTFASADGRELGPDEAIAGIERFAAEVMPQFS